MVIELFLDIFHIAIKKSRRRNQYNSRELISGNGNLQCLPVIVMKIHITLTRDMLQAY